MFIFNIKDISDKYVLVLFKKEKGRYNDNVSSNRAYQLRDKNYFKKRQMEILEFKIQ